MQIFLMENGEMRMENDFFAKKGRIQNSRERGKQERRNEKQETRHRKQEKRPPVAFFVPGAFFLILF